LADFFNSLQPYSRWLPGSPSNWISTGRSRLRHDSPLCYDAPGRL